MLPMKIPTREEALGLTISGGETRREEISDVEMRDLLTRFLDWLENHDLAHFFVEDVDPIEYPEYREVSVLSAPESMVVGVIQIHTQAYTVLAPTFDPRMMMSLTYMEPTVSAVRLSTLFQALRGHQCRGSSSMSPSLTCRLLTLLCHRALECSPGSG